MQGTETQIQPSKSNPALKTETGNKLKIQIVTVQREHMVNRVSSYFPKGGHSETQTEQK